MIFMKKKNQIDDFNKPLNFDVNNAINKQDSNSMEDNGNVLTFLNIN